MAKTWKDMRKRNYVAKDLKTPKYRRRVVPDKRKDAEAEMLNEDLFEEWLLSGREED